MTALLGPGLAALLMAGGSVPCVAETLLAETAAGQTLRIGTEAGYPPYVLRDRSGEITGFDRDLGDAICAEMQVRCDWIDAPFDSLLSDLAAGRYDMVMGGLSSTPARDRIVDFSEGYFTGGVNFSTFAGLNPNQRIDGARIGVQQGTIQEDHLRETGRNLRSYSTITEAFEALLRREIDLVFTSDLVLREAVETRFPGLRQVAQEEVESWDTAIALPEGNGALRDRVNAAIRDLRQDGTIDRLEARWFVSGTTI